MFDNIQESKQIPHIELQPAKQSMERLQARAAWILMAPVIFAGCLTSIPRWVNENETTTIRETYPSSIEQPEETLAPRPVLLDRTRLGFRPGDLIDVRTLREAEGLKRGTNLFVDGNSSPGPGPRVVVKPPDPDAKRELNRP